MTTDKQSNGFLSQTNDRLAALEQRNTDDRIALAQARDENRRVLSELKDRESELEQLQAKLAASEARCAELETQMLSRERYSKSGDDARAALEQERDALAARVAEYERAAALASELAEASLARAEAALAAPTGKPALQVEPVLPFGSHVLNAPARETEGASAAAVTRESAVGGPLSGTGAPAVPAKVRDDGEWLARHHAERASYGGASQEFHARAETWVRDHASAPTERPEPPLPEPWEDGEWRARRGLLTVEEHHGRMAVRMAALVRIEQWTHEYGAALKPPGADTYGEGMRDAKRQVRALLARSEPPLPGDVREVAEAMHAAVKWLRALGRDMPCGEVEAYANRLSHHLQPTRAEPPCIDAEAFQAVIADALAHGIKATDIAHETGVATATVQRWATGIAVPHALMRMPPIAAIARLRARAAEGPTEQPARKPIPLIWPSTDACVASYHERRPQATPAAGPNDLCPLHGDNALDCLCDEPPAGPSVARALRFLFDARDALGDYVDTTGSERNAYTRVYDAINELAALQSAPACPLPPDDLTEATRAVVVGWRDDAVGYGAFIDLVSKLSDILARQGAK